MNFYYLKMKRSEIKTLINSEETNRQVVVKGWVRTRRGSKNVSFIALNDGSSIQNIQLVVDNTNFEEGIIERINSGSCIAAKGTLVASQGRGQNVEIEVKEIEILGEAHPEEYPLQPKKHSLEFLREIAHLRFRTNTFGAINRIRHAMIFAIHEYFHTKGFYNIHTPIITGSDAEGAGETFKVSNFDFKNIPLTKEGEVDYKQDFFGREANLTVSGQLEAELAAMALGKVYTFGPTFRAENSNTRRHLSEFWMIEPEVAFADLEEIMDLGEDLLKSVIRYALKNCIDDLEFLDKRQADEDKTKKEEDRAPMGLIGHLEFVVNNNFERVPYTEAIEILRNSKPNKKKRFKYLIDEWGADLQSEHERYLVEKHFKKPVILYDYPKEIKAFYMRQNEDGKTVKAMDILFPGIGEIVGGSQREERLDFLENRMNEMNIPKENLWWYLDLRKFGTAPHAGFGLGFERLMLFMTGMENIRDVIPFPRTPKHAEF